MKIGIDSYGLYPLGLMPIETLQWAEKHGAEGVQFSGLTEDVRKEIDRSYLDDLSHYAQKHDLYLEWGGAQHIPRDMDSWNKKDIFEVNQTAAVEAEILGTRIIRSCSGGLMRWNDKSPSTETLLAETAQTLKSQRQMLKDHNVILAIETHFEFTTHELLNLFDMCEAEPGEYLGICLDTMNLLTMLEDPLCATERILPWVVCTHIKDGGILLDANGMTTFPLEIGQGIVDLPTIIDCLSSLPRDINLSVEDHGGEFHLPIFDQQFLAEFPHLTTSEFLKLINLAQMTESKKIEGKINITKREDWQNVCELRIENDIKALKNIL
ncbi:MAG: TIM barrel protein [Candidatus Electryonea clarkiae]|nr:TIM barrel protein [Candidatus Electryonea clarkiae]MDP8289145.1 TIM barrel protein [Candidatus Electryonea clarkiae]